MDDFAKLPASDRSLAFAEAARRRRVTPLVVEKDFWSCWMLRRLFRLADPPAAIVFKGGTSLSKVYGAIDRFSEDLDLTFDRGAIGFGEGDDPAHIVGTKARRRKLDALREASRAFVADALLPLIREEAMRHLGGSGGRWSLDLDPDDPDGQSVLFRYPALMSGGAGYLKPRVKLEFGGRGDREPSERAAVAPYVAEELPDAAPDAATEVTVLRADRTFWEKATILHMLHHRPGDRPLPAAMSRHYYDLALLSRHPMGERALNEPGLLAEVAAHKQVFFSAAWARYEEAAAGTLRLVPPPARVAELRRDYDRMRAEMMFGDAPGLEALLEELATLEARING